MRTRLIQTIRSEVSGTSVRVERVFFDLDENLRIIEITQDADASEMDVVNAVEQYLRTHD